MFHGNKAAFLVILIITLGSWTVMNHYIEIRKNELRQFEKRYSLLCSEFEARNQEEIIGDD